MADNTFTTEVWYSQSQAMTYPWPEQQAGVKANVGVCFSGGGTRALSATMGQLRALLSLNLLSSIDYISCVSGGSWASTAFVYYNEGATSDAEFLGAITEPKDITLDALKVISTSSLGWGATQNLGDALDAAHRAGVSDKLLWAAAVGQLFFARFGLYDPNNPSYFSLDDATVAKIRAANPSLAAAPFHTVRTPAGYTMPYLLINATIDGPTAHAPYNPDQLLEVTYSPLYSGIPFQQTMSYPVAKTAGLKPPPVTAVVGGGFIQSFAWGCDAPETPAAASGGSVTVGAPASVFSLVDASGASSSAYAAILEKIKFLDGLLPEQNYWPPMATAPQTPAQLFDFGDGGNLENYGIIPLLMRGVKKVVVFINTETPMNVNYDPTQKTDENDLDEELPALFGIPVYSHDFSSTKKLAPDYNQVFPTADYAAVIQALQALKKQGQPMVFHKTHVLQKNTYWGLAAGGIVDVMYVYLDEVQTWRAQLTDHALRTELDLRDLGMFPHFPNYHTIDENIIPTPGEKIIPPWNLTEFTPQQVNLLADLTCWVVRNSGVGEFIG
ncbi:MAG TPA: hypothetical protein VEK57_05325 [Thermoanaerobaculia bacterium]|nr:hypothetical protein [Thermoanaerobaculia bacterium]